MKHFTILFLAFAMGSLAYAQSHDLSIELIQPRNGFVSGVQFTFEAHLKNAGPDDISAGNTVHFQPTFNGQPLLEMGQPVAYQHTFGENLSASDTVKLTRQLTIIGGSIGQVVVCAKIMEHTGVDVENELDSTNWQDCANMIYSDNASTGEFRIMYPKDRSKIDGQTLVVDIVRIPRTADAIGIRLIDIAGKTMIDAQARAENNQLYALFELPILAKGIYLLHTTDGRQLRVTKKLVVHQ